MTHDKLPHITWCATGPLAFLPLHAAGLYRPTSCHLRKAIFDFVTSSYTSSLSALLPHCGIDQGRSGPLTILAISQPATPGQSHIPATHDEIRKIKGCVEHVTWLDHDQATVDAVLNAMDQHNIVHLACHGIQDRLDATNSALMLFDGRLTLGRLMGKSLKNAELAVLSACQTATGD